MLLLLCGIGKKEPEHARTWKAMTKNLGEDTTVDTTQV